MSGQRPKGPITAQWAFVMCVLNDGRVHLVDHEFNYEVKALRVATLDDIDAACAVVAHEQMFSFKHPGAGNPYTDAFLVFQLSDGHIAASPDIFLDMIALSGPSSTQIRGALHVLQSQILAQRTADITAPLAAEATLSLLSQVAMASDPDAAKKSSGGLIVA